LEEEKKIAARTRDRAFHFRNSSCNNKKREGKRGENLVEQKREKKGLGEKAILGKSEFLKHSMKKGKPTPRRKGKELVENLRPIY